MCQSTGCSHGGHGLGVESEFGQGCADLGHVLVSPPADTHKHILVLGQGLGQLEGVVGRMCTLKCRDDPLQLAHLQEALECLPVCDAGVLGPQLVLEPCVLRAHPGIVQAGADAVCGGDLALVVLQQVCAGAVQHPRLARTQSGRMPPRLHPVTTSLHAHQLHLLVVDERVEDAHGIAATAHTGNHIVRQFPGRLEHLLTGLLADDRLKVAHNHGEWIGPNHRPNQVVRGGDVCDPVAHGLVNGILQCPCPGLHWHDLGPQQLHAEHVQRLSLYVLSPHVHGQVQVQHGADRGCGHTVLACACLGNDAALAQALGQQGLAYGVVDLV
eukprot:comp24164_c0_seq1/m.44071 comp24164_c0_seq1/g.44071  ORF comp24164_c0_seq1/g.44071 comp24164_c0_seq1/m.44071 type:complete len:327 (+) comp24164_c0_seq1:222-1202(+)